MKARKIPYFGVYSEGCILCGWAFSKLTSYSELNSWMSIASSFSGIVVRLYTAKDLHHHLDQARSKFIRADIMVRTQKVYHRSSLLCIDAALELPICLRWCVRACIKHRKKKIRMQTCKEHYISRMLVILNYGSWA